MRGGDIGVERIDDRAACPPAVTRHMSGRTLRHTAKRKILPCASVAGGVSPGSGATVHILHHTRRTNVSVLLYREIEGMKDARNGNWGKLVLLVAKSTIRGKGSWEKVGR